MLGDDRASALSRATAPGARQPPAARCAGRQSRAARARRTSEADRSRQWAAGLLRDAVLQRDRTAAQPGRSMLLGWSAMPAGCSSRSILAPRLDRGRRPVLRVVSVAAASAQRGLMRHETTSRCADGIRARRRRRRPAMARQVERLRRRAPEPRATELARVSRVAHGMPSPGTDRDKRCGRRPAQHARPTLLRRAAERSGGSGSTVSTCSSASADGELFVRTRRRRRCRRLARPTAHRMLERSTTS